MYSEIKGFFYISLQEKDFIKKKLPVDFNMERKSNKFHFKESSTQIELKITYNTNEITRNSILFQFLITLMYYKQYIVYKSISVQGAVAAANDNLVEDTVQGKLKYVIIILLVFFRNKVLQKKITK